MDWKAAAEQMEKNGAPANVMGYCMIAFDLGRQSGIESVKAVPNRAMFDEGVSVGTVIAAKEAHRIAQACEFGYQAAKAIREKFGLKI